ncbi:MAG: PIN domain-containing protein [Nitrospirales bacterium]|nr:PIN domain-containing protein [Nitrospirales bacterium]
MIVLLDTDVLIDVALDRTSHVEASIKLLEALEMRRGQGFVAWHSLSNFYYLVSPAKGAHHTRDFLDDLIRFIDIAPTNRDSFHLACQFPMKDFEDAMQVAAAMACGADVIATRNIRDYAQASMRVTTPALLVKDMK